MHFHEFFSYLFFKLTSNSLFFYAYFYLFIFYVFYFVTSFSRKLNFITPNIQISIPLISIAFLITKITNFKPFCFIIFKVTNSFSTIQKNTNFNKFTQNAHSTPVSFLSPQIMHLDSSSHITPHHYPTHHHSSPKIIQNSPKNSFFFAKFQTTLSYPPLNLILHSW